MRYSDSGPLDIEDLGAPKSNADVVTKAARDRKKAWTCALVFVGGNDWRSMALRRAQAHLRFDRRPSYWSHVGLLLDWNVSSPEQSWGVEVSLEPAPPHGHAPEHNGVTPFRLERYLDASRWVNFCIAALDAQDKASATTTTQALREAALEPQRRALRYPLWDWLGIWARYSYQANAIANPLRENVPMPSAALVELALDAAGIAAAPGATNLDTSPETLWSTIRHWHDRMAEGIGVQAWRSVRDEAGTTAPASSLTIAPLDSQTPTRGRRARRKS